MARMRSYAGLVAAALSFGAVVLAPSPIAAETRGLDPRKAFTQYGLDVWTTEEGLPNSSVNALLQTRDGYLWIGTYDGLARFDGVRFTIFNTSNTPELGSNGVRALAEDRDGNLWIGTNGGGLTRFFAGRFTRYTTAQGLTNDFVWALLPDEREGGLWIGTNGGGLVRYQDGRFHAYPPGDSGRTVYSIARDKDGSLWLGTQSEGVRRLSRDGRFTTFTASEGLPGSIATAVAVDRSGGVWVGTTGGGLARLEGERFSPVKAIKDHGLINIAAIREDREGTLWIGTNGSGLGRYRDGELTVMTPAQGLPESVVYSLLEDREGSLWIGTNGGGLGRLRDGSFLAYSTQEGLARDLTYATFEDSAGRIWIGTSGGVDRLENGRATPEVLDPKGRPLAVRSLAQDQAGDLWAGTYGGGLFRRHGRRWTAYTVLNGLAHDSVRAVLADRGGRIWAGTIGGLSVLEKGAWRTYRAKDGLPRDSVIGLLEDRHGRIWAGSDGGGLSRLEDGRIHVFTTKDGLASNVVLALFEDDDGTLWIGTNGGLSRHQDGRFQTFTATAGLPSDAVSQIVDDGHGHLWLGTSKGISRVTKASLAAFAESRGSLDVVTFGRTDGMKSSQCTAPGQPGGVRGRDGRLWFSTTRGSVVVDPATLKRDTEPPPVVIEEVSIDGRNVALADALVRVPPGAGRIQVRYTGLSLLSPARVSFRFRLEGFDPGWVDAGGGRVADYTGLPPGDYVFRVKARSPDGVWNESGRSLTLRVEPRFYETRLFGFGLALAILGLAAGGYRLRVRSFEGQERELKLLVEERTRKLAEEKERAERASREAEDASAFKTELVGIAAHDLRSPLTGILGRAELLRDGKHAVTEVPEMAEAIYRASRRMLGRVEALLTNAALERGAIQLSLRRVDLGGLASSVAEEARHEARRKDQEIRLEVQEGVLVEADEDRLRQVIENLVGNAIKFSPRAGTITLSAGTEGAEARVTVRDEGLGLTPEDLNRLFGTFAPLSARPTGGERSTGLGLSIVKRLVELHGGRVWAESEGSNRGAAFHVALPAPPRA